MSLSQIIVVIFPMNNTGVNFPILSITSEKFPRHQIKQAFKHSPIPGGCLQTQVRGRSRSSEVWRATLSNQIVKADSRGSLAPRCPSKAHTTPLRHYGESHENMRTSLVTVQHFRGLSKQLPSNLTWCILSWCTWRDIKRWLLKIGHNSFLGRVWQVF